MKIRTDFVTNSSSSSFVVEITVNDNSGKAYSVLVDPSQGDGLACVDVTCSAEEIASVKSVNELTKLLTSSLTDEECDISDSAGSLKKFEKEVKEGISGLDQISTVKLKRIWEASGEAASAFGWNLDTYAPELPDLAEKVCNSEGKEKDAAKKELEEYLLHYNGEIEGEWGGSFPSGFMGSVTEGSIVWNKCADTIEEFAQQVLDNKLPIDDYAEEIVEIDIKNHTVKRSAEYILNGVSESGDYDDEKDENEYDDEDFEDEYENEDENEEFCIENGVITEYTGNDKDVVIPKGVTDIGEYAFDSCKKLESVTTPNSVTSIGYGAFYGCINLRSITIPDSITSIDENAFENCSKITCNEYDNALYLGNKHNPYLALIKGKDKTVKSVNISEKTKIIACGAFDKCSGLINVTIPDSVIAIPACLFDNCSKLVYNEYDNALYLGNINNPYYALIKAKDKSITSVDINEKTKIIADKAFDECSNLTSVTIPDSVTSMGWSVFGNCSSLTSVTITDGVTSIGNDAFRGCSNLTSVTIPNSVTSIGDSAFWNCSSLTSVTLPNGVTSIGNDAFWSCSSLTNITIPDSVKTIGQNAFSYCSNLTSVIMPDSVKSIGDQAFNGCELLTIHSPAGSYREIKKELNKNDEFYIENRILEKYNGTDTDVRVPDGVTGIGWEAFHDKRKIEKIYLPDSVTFIERSAFSGCNDLASINIPDVVTKIEDHAFYICRSLKSINIPDSVKSIGEYAFSGCSSLESVNIPFGITKISDYTFSDCSNMTSINLTESITSIGWGAFFGCSNLIDINASRNVTEISDNAFKGCDNIMTITVGKWIEEKSLSNVGLTAVKNVIIADSVSKICNFRFSRCDNITSITIPASVNMIEKFALPRRKDLVITTPAGSYAYEFAKNNGIKVITPEENNI